MQAYLSIGPSRVRPALLFSGLFVLAACALPPASAQPPETPPAAVAPPADVDDLIRLLEDDEARARLIERLRASGNLDEQAEPEPSFASKLAGYTRGAAEAAAGASAALTELVRQASEVFSGAVGVDIAALRTTALSIALLLAITFGVFVVLQLAFRALQGRLARAAALGDLVDRSKAIVLSGALDFGRCSSLGARATSPRSRSASRVRKGLSSPCSSTLS